MRFVAIFLFAAFLLAGCATTPPRISHAQAQAQVEVTERAFARTMADRDYNAFTRFLADEAIFFGGAEPLRGKEQIAIAWKKFYTATVAPFSWEPAHVEVLDSGTLALSTGPVHDATGKCIATFNSIWRREPSGDWRIVFDKGSDGCDGS
ncbi:MAG: DUF4440 domain-containing protein [Rudaea sp.]|nr:DUF4440 domain-containing protein [Rudaea sp.]